MKDHSDKFSVIGAGSGGLGVAKALKEAGAKLPTTHLIDLISSLRRMRIANWTLPL